MSHLRDLPPFQLLHFYATSPYECSYLTGHTARSQVAAPSHLIDTSTYTELAQAGFRRSGVFTYRPYCNTCSECHPLRVDVARFVPKRNQRRAVIRHVNLLATECPLDYSEEHYQLYQRYQMARHSGGGMDQDNRDQYDQFLLQSHIDTRLIEFRENGVLRIVSIIDVLDDGLSSVYSFYDPDIPHASYGTYAVIWQIAQCQHARMPWLYLGYWIPGSRKMAYKVNFQPAQILRKGTWETFAPTP